MNSTTNSLKRVYGYLKPDRQITPTQLGTELNLHYNSVLACLEVLKTLNTISMISNGKVTLVSLKDSFKQDDNNRRH